MAYLKDAWKFIVPQYEFGLNRGNFYVGDNFTPRYMNKCVYDCKYCEECDCDPRSRDEQLGDAPHHMQQQLLYRNQKYLCEQNIQNANDQFCKAAEKCPNGENPFAGYQNNIYY